MRLKIKLASSFLIVAVISCVSVNADLPQAQQAQTRLKDKFNIDYLSEAQFKEVVVKGQADAFDLFLKAYNNLPCPGDGLVRNIGAKDGWCYAEEHYGASIGKRKKMDRDRVAWLIEQFSNESIPRDKRIAMLNSMRPYKLPRSFVLNLVRWNHPATINNKGGIKLTPAANCMETEISIMMEMEKNSRDRMRIWGEWPPCEGPEKMTASVVHTAAAAMCPLSVRTSMQGCAQQSITGLQLLEKTLISMVNANDSDLPDWLGDQNIKKRFEATVQALKDGANLACRKNDLDACRAGRDLPASIMASFATVSGKYAAFVGNKLKPESNQVH